MLFREIKNKLRLCLLLVLLVLPCGNAIGVSKDEAGSVIGSMLFVDKREKTTLGEATDVTVELEPEEPKLTICERSLRLSL